LPEVAVLDIASDQVPAFVVLAKDAAANGRPDDAANIYREILRSNPGNDDVKIALAQLAK
jgi:hypothetical protein